MESICAHTYSVLFDLIELHAEVGTQ